MHPYLKIVNPYSGRKVLINGKLSKKILQNYFDILKGGASKFGKKKPNACILFLAEETYYMGKLHKVYTEILVKPIKSRIVKGDEMVLFETTHKNSYDIENDII